MFIYHCSLHAQLWIAKVFHIISFENFGKMEKLFSLTDHSCGTQSHTHNSYMDQLIIHVHDIVLLVFSEFSFSLYGLNTCIAGLEIYPSIYHKV